MALVTAPVSSPAYYTHVATAINNSNQSLGDSVERLSTGNRIIQISDDVAATSISTQLKTQLSGLRQSASNIAEATSLLQVANDGLENISMKLDTLQSIAQQASSTGLSSNDRYYLQQQFNDNLAQIDTIANNNSFNNINLLDGTLASGTAIRVGANPTDVINITIASVKNSALFNNSNPDVATTVHAVSAQTAITTASNTVMSILQRINGNQSGFDSATTSLQHSIDGVNKANNALIDTNDTAESASATRDKLHINFGTTIAVQLKFFRSGLLSLIH